MIKNRFYWFAMVALLCSMIGCGIWNDLTTTDEAVYLKGDKGQACSLNSECKSGICVFPGICE